MFFPRFSVATGLVVICSRVRKCKWVPVHNCGSSDQFTVCFSCVKISVTCPGLSALPLRCVVLGHLMQKRYMCMKNKLLSGAGDIQSMYTEKKETYWHYLCFDFLLRLDWNLFRPDMHMQKGPRFEHPTKTKVQQTPHCGCCYQPGAVVPPVTAPRSGWCGK